MYFLLMLTIVFASIEKHWAGPWICLPAFGIYVALRAHDCATRIAQIEQEIANLSVEDNGDIKDVVRVIGFGADTFFGTMGIGQVVAGGINALIDSGAESRLKEQQQELLEAVQAQRRAFTRACILALLSTLGIYMAYNNGYLPLR